VSVGVASVVPRDDLERTALVDDADQALYRAKQQGRNQVVAAA
jgi:diguanylate cyclase (GGDEF)-like protein